MTLRDAGREASQAIENLTDAADQQIAAAQTPPPEQAQTPEPPSPEPWVAMGERLGRLESRLEQPFQDPRVDDLSAQIKDLPNQIMQQFEQADPIAAVEEVTGEVGTAAGEVAQAGLEAAQEVVEQAPRRIHPLLRRFGGR